MDYSRLVKFFINSKPINICHDYETLLTYKYNKNSEYYFVNNKHRLILNELKTRRDMMRLNAFIKYTGLFEDKVNLFLVGNRINYDCFYNYLDKDLYKNSDIKILYPNINYIDSLILLKSKLNLIIHHPQVYLNDYNYKNIIKYILINQNKIYDEDLIGYNNIKYPIYDKSYILSYRRIFYWKWQVVDNLIHLDKLNAYHGSFKFSNCYGSELLITIKKCNIIMKNYIPNDISIEKYYET